METLPIRTDPVEAEPLYHFHPRTLVLRSNRLPSDLGRLVGAAVTAGARSLALPADLPACRELARLAGLRGIRVVSSCAGRELSARFNTLRWVDALVVRLSTLEAAETIAALGEIERVVGEGVWVEIHCTVFSETDADHSIDAITQEVVGLLGPEVPLHVRSICDDPPGRECARRARWIAVANGLHWVYGGDRMDERSTSSWCPGCDDLLASRHQIRPTLEEMCPACRWPVPGRFARNPRRRSSQTLRRVLPPAARLEVGVPHSTPTRRFRGRRWRTAG